ncbi:MAG: hypothetical protein HOP28_16080 [Gemmatimonadales bacterium]|nr:hypothetical protein [Gemmatimonadales bacterium]
MKPQSDAPVADSDLFLAFAPIHKAAFGVAIGVVSALVVFLLTAIVLLRHQEQVIPLELLSVYLKGYSVSWTGALKGAAWGGIGGFVFGWFAAFCRNLALAISLFVIRSRAELAQTRDFLDHV